MKGTTICIPTFLLLLITNVSVNAFLFTTKLQYNKPLTVCQAKEYSVTNSSHGTDEIDSYRPRRSFAQTAHVPKRGNPDKSKDSRNKPSSTASSASAKTISFRGDSALVELHQQRVKTAGRVGTKRYVNPCKVFIGNLPFDCGEKDLEEFVCEKVGLPANLLLHQSNIVRDWKTGVSKGYGFVLFTEAVYATVCIDKCNGADYKGRKLTVNQGKKKLQDTVFIKKKNDKPKDAEEEAIQKGIKKAKMDPQEAAMLRYLDPDLVDDDDVIYKDEFEGSDEDLEWEEVMDDDLDDDGVDGVWYGDEEDDMEEFKDSADGDTPMNRQKRREVARRRKRKKLPRKGFQT